jgi:oxygen-independent coproporphyrinogen-3 oxidase
MTSPPERRDDQPFGVYLHIPFCAHRCDYCAFATWADRGHLIDEYLAALATEVREAIAEGVPPATSVFVGGGTPTLVDPRRLAAIVGSVPTADGAEVTVECNPESLTPAHVEAYLEAGVDRLSLGVQSMVPSVLRSLGREHAVSNVVAAVGMARAGGVENLNLDVIYGAVGESTGDWQRTIDEVIGLDPDHVSAYALTVEPGTPLAADASRHPDDDAQAEKYAVVTDALAAAGYEWYEISNWSRPGRQCRHNLLYWAQGDYRGFGCAAHSHEDGRRWWNVRTPERYVEAVRGGGSVVAGEEELDDDVRRLEGLQLALRTQGGVPTSALAPDDRRALTGLVAQVDDRVVLTPAGRLMANEVAVRLR